MLSPLDTNGLKNILSSLSSSKQKQNTVDSECLQFPLMLCLNTVLEKAHKTWTVNLTRMKQSVGKIDKGFGVFPNIWVLIILFFMKKLF